ncbi:hypothetical protein [Acinetobacter ursingii]|uniref:hypothetical protein n=1 Tax=Acinetobacter ursingii TaxID=108980 RepID=UPI00300BE803
MYDYKQKRFQKVFEKSYSDLLNTDLENGLYHISDEFYFDILIKNFDDNFFKSDKIVVCFSGAVVGRQEKTAPFFLGADIVTALRIPVIAFSDPQVSASKLNVAWYVGGKDNLNYPKKVLNFLKYINEKYQKEFIFFGGAGGGYAALLYANLFGKPASCLVWNPQIKIENYVDMFVDRYINIAFDNNNKFTSNMSRKSFLKKKGVYNDISDLKLNKNLKIIYLQNLKDIFHINHHLRFFMAGKKWKRLDNNTVVNNQIIIHYGNWGEGHVMPQKHIIQNVLEKMVKNKGLLDCLENKDNFIDRTVFKYDEIDLAKEKLRLSPLLTFENDKLQVNLRVLDDVGCIVSDSLRYACYLLYDDEVSSKKMYQKSSLFEFDLSSQINGKVIVRCYIRDANKIVVMNNFVVSPDIYRI